MTVGVRSRLMIAALVFALAWALGVAVHRFAHISITILCLSIGSVAISYLVGEYHRAWRLHPSSAGSKVPLSFRSWSGINVDGLTVRPEYVTATLTLLLCVLGMVMYLEASSHPAPPAAEPRPPLLLPEAKPLQ